MLPQALPEPVFQTALNDSCFGFSASEGSFNLPSRNVLNIGQHVRAITLNPTHSNIDDNGNNDDSSDSSSEDSDSDDANDKNGEENNNNDAGDNNFGFYDDYNANNNEGIFGNHIMGKSLPMSLVMYKLIV